MTVYTFPAEGGGLEIMDVTPSTDAYARASAPAISYWPANGQTITSTQDLTRLKQSLGLGDTVSLTYLRDGQSYTVDVALVDPQEDNR